MHLVAHYDAGRLVAGSTFLCGSSVGVFAGDQLLRKNEKDCLRALLQYIGC